MTRKYYITTPIYYINSRPHLGHAYTNVMCDVLARFKRLDGYDVYFLTGTDEHGEKVERVARELDINTQEFIDSLVPAFKEILSVTNCSYNDFIRTSETRHKDFVQNIWRKMFQSGDIYLGQYSGWYSVNDETFFSESELINGRAPSGAEVHRIEEPSYFFKLSKWQDRLIKFYKLNPDFISPKSRRNEIVSFISSGLHDISVSRTSISHGISVPDDGKHVMYVWIDALFNYISALTAPHDIYKKYWPCDLHVIGKEILRFHAIYWPAFLMAAELPLPKQIFAHGWWVMADGQKMSKSLGNVVDPIELCKKFGTDSLRYFLIRDIASGHDGRYSIDNLIVRVNSELVNSIGNLVHRVLSFVYKNCNKRIPSYHFMIQDDIALLDNAYSTLSYIRKMLDVHNLSKALGKIYELSNAANIYVNQHAPWKLKRDDIKRMETVLYVLCETIRVIAIVLQPFIPESALKLLTMLGISAQKNGVEFNHCCQEYSIVEGSLIQEPEVIFKRLEK